MSVARKITVELTEQQHRALAGAVVAYHSLWDEDDAYPGYRRDCTVLDRAWEKIQRAWYRQPVPQHPSRRTP